MVMRKKLTAGLKLKTAILLIIALTIILSSQPATATSVAYDCDSGTKITTLDNGNRVFETGLQLVRTWNGGCIPMEQVDLSENSSLSPYLHYQNNNNTYIIVNDSIVMIPMEENKLRFSLDKISWTQTFPKTLLAKRMQNTTNASIGKIRIPHRLIAGAVAQYREHGIDYGRLRFKGGREHVDIYDETGRHLSRSDYDFRIKNKEMWLFFNKQAASKLQGNISFDFHSWYVENATTSWANVSLDNAVERGNHTITLDSAVPGYISWWDFRTDNTGSTTLWDVNRTSANDGTIYGAVWNTTDGGLYFDGTDDYVDVPSFNYAFDNITIIARVKRASASDSCKGVVFSRSTTGCGMNIGACRDGTRLGYHWNGNSNTYGWVGGPIVPADETVTAALTVQANRADAYVIHLNGSVGNGTNNISHASSTLDALRIGEDSISTARRFYGTIYDVYVWRNRVLSLSEIKNVTNYTTIANITNNWTYAIGSDEELKTLGCNVTGTADGSRTVDIIGSTDNVTWITEATNVTGNATVDVSGKGYKYGGCRLQTTDASLTPEVVSLRAETGFVPASIIGWGNNYTNDESLNLSLATPSPVRFNVTAYGAPDTVDYYEWYLDGVAQSRDADNFTHYFNTTGTHSVRVDVVNTTLGNNNSLTWNVSLGFVLLSPANGSTIYTPYPPLPTDVNFSWYAVDYPYYNLRVSEDSNFNLLVTDTYTTNTYATVGLEDGVYYWQVRSYKPDTGVYESESNVYTLTVTHNTTGDGTSGIQGVVYTGTDTPLSGALVTIWNNTWTDTMVTGTNGYYLFNNLDNTSTYSIQAKKSGYDDSEILLVTPPVGNWTTKNIYLRRCTSEWGCSFNQQYVEFTLLTASGSPVAHATVNVYKADNPVAEYTGETDTSGSVTFLLIKDQEYRITFVNASQGVSEEVTLYPKDDHYTIFVGAMSEHELAYWYTTTQDNTTNNTGTITLHYSDWSTPINTAYVNFELYNADNGSLVFSQNLTNVSSSNTITTPSLDATQTYKAKLTVSHADLGVFNAYSTIVFVVPGHARLPLGDLNDWQLTMFSMFLVIGLALVFGAVNSAVGGLIVAFTAGLLYYWGWMPLISSSTAVVIFPFVILMAIVNLLVNHPSKYAGGGGG